MFTLGSVGRHYRSILGRHYRSTLGRYIGRVAVEHRPRAGRVSVVLSADNRLILVHLSADSVGDVSVNYR